MCAFTLRFIESGFAKAILYNIGLLLLFKFILNEKKLIKILKSFFFTLVYLYITPIIGQVYYGRAANTCEIYQITVTSDNCSCDVTLLPVSTCHGEDATYCEDGNLYLNAMDGIYQFDIASGVTTLAFPFPPSPLWPVSGLDMTGLACGGDSIFYFVVFEVLGSNNWLYQFDASTEMFTNLGLIPFNITSGLSFANGNLYGADTYGIIDVNIPAPTNSMEVVSILPYNPYQITTSHICNSLIGNSVDELVNISLIDGSITKICDLPVILTWITSPLDVESNVSPCEIYIDLDCDDSSGATEADYNSPEFDCLSDGVGIADEDIQLLYDAIITSMTIEVTGFVPDAPNEIIDIMGSVPGINVTGAGTDMITLSNAGGAKSTDFKEALRLVVYDNTALLPTAGLRTVEVQFTTSSGAMSNIATAFIQVNELPLLEVDLGPDQQACEGETATFDAGNPGATYEWSSGESTQIITPGIEDEYIVTVSNGVDCPNQDTVLLDVLPVIHVSLTGDDAICDNQQASITINTDATFPLTVEISAEPGSPFIFNDVIGNYTFQDLPSEETVYTITGVTPSQDACIEITDPVHAIDVYPTYNHQFNASVCEGDSIWLGFYWETEPGVYENAFTSFDGCDSVVTTNLSVLPAITISQQGTTCDSSAAGVFLEYLNNPNGCDTVIQTTITLLSSDTTHLASSSCNLASAGIFTQALSNQEGCDSLVITTVSWIPPADTTLVNATSCDSTQTGVFQQLLLDQTGCDSMVITTVKMGPADTTYTFGTSCDITMIGITETLYNNQQGCDSLVITNISAGQPDTTYINNTSCDSASLGVFEELFVSQLGCDSTVITTVAYSASDSTFIQSASCDPADVGVFVDSYINQFGCDSIVTETVTLLSTDETFLTSSTCDPAAAGVFVQTLINLNGCDSIVTETVELLPSDETFLFSTTCMSSQAGMFITTHLNQYGCDSTVTLTVSLVPADTTILSFKTCDPTQVGNIENTYTNIDGCDSLVIEQTTLYSLPELQLSVTSDYNGYAISCYGESDGSANAEVTGVPPWTYLWSTGNTDQTITGLAAGSYAVTVTDGNGCVDSDEVMLFEPEEFSISFIVSQPDCFDQQVGSITIEQIGGIEPIRYSIDEINYQSSPVFDNLSGGTYTVTAIDANDCEVKEIIWINVPLMVHVELPDDQMAFLGDTVLINAIVNVPYDSLASVVWSGLNNPVCPTCLSQPVAPIITTTYSVMVTSLDGCMDEDAMTLFLERNDDVYVPNVFSPNGDGINEELIIYSGSDVEKILEWVIFDRWGNVVFSANNFLPNDASISWDGKMKGKEVNPGVFAYRMIVKFHDGQQNILYGDITLMR